MFVQRLGHILHVVFAGKLAEQRGFPQMWTRPASVVHHVAALPERGMNIRTATLRTDDNRYRFLQHGALKGKVSASGSGREAVFNEH